MQHREGLMHNSTIYEDGPRIGFIFADNHLELDFDSPNVTGWNVCSTLYPAKVL